MSSSGARGPGPQRALFPGTRLRAAAPPGSPSFRVQVLQHPDVQSLLGDHPLQLAVLTLELLQSPRFRNIHPAELRAPAVERLLGNIVEPADLSNVSRLLGFLQNPDDLLFRKLLPLRLVSDRLPKRLTQRLDSLSRGQPPDPFWHLAVGPPALSPTEMVTDGHDLDVTTGLGPHSHGGGQRSAVPQRGLVAVPIVGAVLISADRPGPP